MKKILILSVGGSSEPIVKVVSREQFYQLNNSLTFGEKPKNLRIFLTGCLRL